jgi:hypothetical protein
MHLNLKTTCSLILMIGCLMTGSVVRATQLRFTDLKDLAGLSDAVVQGQLLSKDVLMAGNVPWTIYTMSVDATLAGSVDGERLSFRCIGGPHDGDGYFMLTGTPQIEVGDQFVLFYSANEKLCQISGFELGVFWLANGAGGKARLVDHEGRALAALSERGKVVSGEVVQIRPGAVRTVPPPGSDPVSAADASARGVSATMTSDTPPPPAAEAAQILSELKQFVQTNVRTPRKVTSTTDLSALPELAPQRAQ